MELPVIIGLGHPNAAKVVDNVRLFAFDLKTGPQLLLARHQGQARGIQTDPPLFHMTTLRSLVPKLLTMAKGGTLWGWQRRTL